MVNKPSTQVSLGIFSAKPKPNLEIAKTLNAKPETLTGVDVGGLGDCGFRSIAAAMINNILVNPSRANQELARKILRLHKDWFTQVESNDLLLTPAQRLEKLLKPLAYRGQFIVELAHALRQEAVDYVDWHPERYLGTWSDTTEGSSPAEMRSQFTWIDESYIDAVAQVMEIPINVQVVEPNKPIYRLDPYRPQDVAEKETASPITIQLQGRHYIPKVNMPEYFESIRGQKIGAVQSKLSAPKRQNRPSTEVFAEKTKIAQEIDERYENTANRLEAMMLAGEHTIGSLLAIFTKGMQNSDYLQSYVCIEHGNQHFFDQIKARLGDESVSSPQASYDSYDDYLAAELIHALARAISIGHEVYPGLVYESEEQVSPRI